MSSGPRAEFEEITTEMRTKAILAYRNRLQTCIDRNGGHVEVEVI